MKHLRIILGLLLPLAAAVALFLWTRAPATPANVLLITIDTLRADHLGIYGYDRDTSPALDRFAAGATVFERAFTHAQLSGPSHATMFSGLYPPQHGVINNAITLPGATITVAEVLRASGYDTAMFVSHGLVSDEYGFGQGFDVVERHDVYSHGPDHRHEDDVEARGPVGAVFEGFIDWLDRPKESPFFAWLHVQHPHKSYDPPEPYDRMFLDPPVSRHELNCVSTIDDHEEGEIDLDADELSYVIALYDGEIAYVDAQLERVFDRLHESGLAKETVVIVTADHGEMLFDDPFQRLAGHGHYRFDPVLRVPLVIADPRKAVARRVDTMVGLIDLAPTILDAAGIPAPKDFGGISLLPLARGKKIDSPREHHISCTFHGDGTARLSLRTTASKLMCNKRKEDWDCVLFDLELDPLEQGTADGDPGTYERLLAALQEWYRDSVTEGRLTQVTPSSKRARAMLRRAGYLKDDEGSD